MPISEKELLFSRIVPPVQKLRLDSDEIYKLAEGCKILLRAPENIVSGCIDIIRKTALIYWKLDSISFVVSELQEAIPAEGYSIKVKSEELILETNSIAGIKNALKTLRQLAEPERGVEKFSHFILPAVKINDFPALSFRGIHLCWFPESSILEIEKTIRIAAYYKFNYAIVEPWGIFKFKSHPEFCWNEFGIAPEEFRRLVRLGKELGITLIPQVNILGHAAFARCGSGKHLLLDFYPEYASLFEPDGWTWCISNPYARQYLTDLVLEIYEAFDSPPFFHAGCDEAFNAASCTICRRSNYASLLKEHILYFHNLFKERSARMMIWHDMLVTRGDPRWDGYIACGREYHGLSELYRELPKDIIICDWQYDYPKKDEKEPQWPTGIFFKEHGFEVIMCPWLNENGTASLGEFAVKKHMPGLLATSWHMGRAYNLYKIMFYGSCASWNPGTAFNPDIYYLEYFNRHIRECGNDMKISRYIECGSARYQIAPSMHQE